MASLRTQINDILSAESHSVRTAEHTILRRLLYRNTAQHRHGLYLRNLRRVDRSVRVLGVHPVWASLRAAVGVAFCEQASVRQPATLPPSISSLTHHDVSAARSMLDRVVDQHIPNATRLLNSHLVARSRFLPLAVVFISLLARLFVIERALRDRMRALELTIAVQLADDHASGAGVAFSEAGRVAEVGEDLGVCVSEDNDGDSGKDGRGDTSMSISKKIVSGPSTDTHQRGEMSEEEPKKRSYPRTASDFSSECSAEQHTRKRRRRPSTPATPSLYALTKSQALQVSNAEPTAHAPRASVPLTDMDTESLPHRPSKGAKVNAGRSASQPPSCLSSPARSNSHSSEIDDIFERAERDRVRIGSAFTTPLNPAPQLQAKLRTENSSTFRAKPNSEHKKGEHLQDKNKGVSRTDGGDDPDDLDGIFGALDD